MNTRKHCQKFSILIGPVILFLLTGCSESKNQKTVFSSGVVTIDGQPLKKGTVTFQPITTGENNLKRPATGEIDSSGRFQLSTFQAGDGLLPGKYHVVITAFENAPTVEEYAAGAKRKSLIPEKYSNSTTSGLEAVVTDTNNEFTFELHGNK